MPLPVPNLDDRRFDDLVAEARTRLAGHLPELTQIAPGDPVHAFVDLFAWLTETIIYRANLIPERQRKVFLNLLQIPVRPAVPATGFVAIDASPNSLTLQDYLPAGSQLRAGKVTLSTSNEVQPTCLSLSVLIKELLSPGDLEAMGMTLQDLHEQYGLRAGEMPKPFRARQFSLGQETLSIGNTLDQSFYLACIAPKPLSDQMTALRSSFSGLRLNVGIAPADSLQEEDFIVDSESTLYPRHLVWELMSETPDGKTRFLPLEVIRDSSMGGRKTGVVTLRLPANPDLFSGFANADPMFNGTSSLPPAPEDDEAAERVAFWVRLRSPDEPDLKLAYLTINAVDVVAQGQRNDLLIGTGTGLPEQVLQLPDTDIDAASLELQVEENGAWSTWRGMDFTSGQGEDARVYRLDAASGLVYFGDGLDSGFRPPKGARVRVASYRSGGGNAGNLPAGKIKEIVDGSSRLRVRHEWPLSGGRDAESLAQAESRIPQFLTHRNRAVTATDFQALCLNNPVSPVARAEVKEGFLPGATLAAAQRDVPGAISIFVLPPTEVSINNWPRPTRGLLKDVFNYLINRCMVGTELYVLSPQFVPMAVSILVTVRDPSTERETLNEVAETVTQYLSPLAPGGSKGTGWPVGATVRANELMTQAARIPGVLSVNAISIFAQGTNDEGKPAWRRLTANESLMLDDFQLPELAGIYVGASGSAGDGSPGSPNGHGSNANHLLPPFPQGIRDGLTGDDQGDYEIAIPVVPDVC